MYPPALLPHTTNSLSPLFISPITMHISCLKATLEHICKREKESLEAFIDERSLPSLKNSFATLLQSETKLKAELYVAKRLYCLLQLVLQNIQEFYPFLTLLPWIQYLAQERLKPEALDPRSKLMGFILEAKRASNLQVINDLHTEDYFKYAFFSYSCCTAQEFINQHVSESNYFMSFFDILSQFFFMRSLSPIQSIESVRQTLEKEVNYLEKISKIFNDLEMTATQEAKILSQKSQEKLREFILNLQKEKAEFDKGNARATPDLQKKIKIVTLLLEKTNESLSKIYPAVEIRTLSSAAWQAAPNPDELTSIMHKQKNLKNQFIILTPDENFKTLEILLEGIRRRLKSLDKKYFFATHSKTINKLALLIQFVLECPPLFYPLLILCKKIGEEYHEQSNKTFQNWLNPILNIIESIKESIKICKLNESGSLDYIFFLRCCALTPKIAREQLAFLPILFETTEREIFSNCLEIIYDFFFNDVSGNRCQYTRRAIELAKNDITHYPLNILKGLKAPYERIIESELGASLQEDDFIRHIRDYLPAEISAHDLENFLQSMEELQQKTSHSLYFLKIIPWSITLSEVVRSLKKQFSLKKHPSFLSSNIHNYLLASRSNLSRIEHILYSLNLKIKQIERSLESENRNLQDFQILIEIENHPSKITEAEELKACLRYLSKYINEKKKTIKLFEEKNKITSEKLSSLRARVSETKKALDFARIHKLSTVDLLSQEYDFEFKLWEGPNHLEELEIQKIERAKKDLLLSEREFTLQKTKLEALQEKFKKNEENYHALTEKIGHLKSHLIDINLLLESWSTLKDWYNIPVGSVVFKSLLKEGYKKIQAFKNPSHNINKLFYKFDRLTNKKALSIEASIETDFSIVIIINLKQFFDDCTAIDKLHHALCSTRRHSNSLDSKILPRGWIFPRRNSIPATPSQNSRIYPLTPQASNTPPLSFKPRSKAIMRRESISAIALKKSAIQLESFLDGDLEIKSYTSSLSSSDSIVGMAPYLAASPISDVALMLNSSASAAAPSSFLEETEALATASPLQAIRSPRQKKIKKREVFFD